MSNLIPNPKFQISNLKFGFVVALTLVLLTAGIVFGKDSLKSVYQDLIDTQHQVLSRAVSGIENEEKEEVVKEEVPVEISEKEIEELRTEIKKLKEVGIQVKETIKEITRITQVEPVKEITKEVIKIDDKELAKIKTQLAQFAAWGADIENLRAITQKLQVHPAQTPAATAPIYIGSQGIQVGGIGQFASLGVSGSAGIGSLGVGGSASIGSTASDKLTVAATSEFNAPVFAKAGLTVGTGTLNVEGTVRMAGFQLGTTATAGHVLITNASGVGTWQAAPAGVTWPLLSTIDGTVLAPAYSWGADTNMGIRRGGSGNLRFVTTGADRLTIDSAGNVGIGTTGPGRRLEVLNADSVAQLRLSQNSSIFTEFTVAPSTGDLTVSLHPSTSANDIILNMPGGSIGANLWVCEGDACPSLSLSTGGNLIVERDIFATGFRRIGCPTGMIEVPPSPQDGMDGFCVDKYEAKNVGGIATSQADLTPWVSIAQFNARAECIRAGKHLITEKQWQAIAHNIERVGWNWNGGVVGTNQMSDGHSDGVPAGSLVADVIGDPNDDPCVGTGQVCSPTVWNSQRRTYRLSNGQHIWDFGGNVWEWVDQVNEDDYPVHNSPIPLGWVACSTTGDGICGNTLTTNDQWWRGGTFATIGFIRGGYWINGANSGAFTLNLNNAPPAAFASIGFRCAR